MSFFWHILPGTQGFMCYNCRASIFIAFESFFMRLSKILSGSTVSGWQSCLWLSCSWLCPFEGSVAVPQHTRMVSRRAPLPVEESLGKKCPDMDPDGSISWISTSRTGATSSSMHGEGWLLLPYLHTCSTKGAETSRCQTQRASLSTSFADAQRLYWQRLNFPFWFVPGFSF